MIARADFSKRKVAELKGWTARVAVALRSHGVVTGVVAARA